MSFRLRGISVDFIDDDRVGFKFFFVVIIDDKVIIFEYIDSVVSLYWFF